MIRNIEWIESAQDDVFFVKTRDGFIKLEVASIEKLLISIQRDQVHFFLFGS